MVPGALLATLPTAVQWQYSSKESKHRRWHLGWDDTLKLRLVILKKNKLLKSYQTTCLHNTISSLDVALTENC